MPTERYSVKPHNLMLLAPCLLLLGASFVPAQADDLLYGCEGNVPPYDPSEGWIITNEGCNGVCSESLEDGHIVLIHTMASDLYGYLYWIAQPPEEPPPTYWVEWSFRSNHPLGNLFYTCDAYFSVHLLNTHDVTLMYGDAAITFSGDTVIEGLDIDSFHTYRMECVDGVNYRISVDGQVFFVDSGLGSNGYHYIAFGGTGGCGADQIPNMRNEWDMVRYGTINFGERIVAADPPIGFLNPNTFNNLDRFTVTYDSPNYAYIDDISVETTCDAGPPCPEVPQVIATKRLDNGPANVLQIILDRPLPLGERTTFTFTDVDPSNPANPTINTVSYTFQLGDINADGQWNLHDFAALQNCFFQLSAATNCAAFDFNGDIIIDLPDHVAFYSLMTP